MTTLDSWPAAAPASAPASSLLLKRKEPEADIPRNSSATSGLDLLVSIAGSSVPSPGGASESCANEFTHPTIRAAAEALAGRPDELAELVNVQERLLAYESSRQKVEVRAKRPRTTGVVGDRRSRMYECMQMFEAVEIPTVIVQDSMRIQFVNQSASNAMNRTQAEMVHSSVHIFDLVEADYVLPLVSAFVHLLTHFGPGGAKGARLRLVFRPRVTGHDLSVPAVVTLSMLPAPNGDPLMCVCTVCPL